MQSWAELLGIAVGGTVEPPIFTRASASAPGLRVNWALIASARNSLDRPTFIAMKRVTSGAITQLMIQTTRRTITRMPAPLPPPRERDLDRPPPVLPNLITRKAA